ncbi:MAG: polyketide synthase, partial [Chitinivibrionales bacterium]|nr:polyketide synthase [Chitinivibrionales bacterium]
MNKIVQRQAHAVQASNSSAAITSQKSKKAMRNMPPNDDTALAEKLETALIRIVSDTAKIAVGLVGVNENLGNLGFDSVLFTELSRNIRQKYQVDLTPALFFAHNTVRKLRDHLWNEYRPDMQRALSSDDPSASKQIDDLNKSIHSEKLFTAVRSVNSSARSSDPGRDSVAIIGAAGIFPNAKDLNEFWECLSGQCDSITEIPKDRWNWRSYAAQFNTSEGSNPPKHGGFISDVDEFDARFFNIPPLEAEVMDPQHRLFLQTSWKAIEDAGYPVSGLAGKAMGVFAGVQFHDYQQLLEKSAVIRAQMTTGNASALLANRISYILNLHGPSEVIDTACSSSLVAVHRAVQSIQQGECELALAGGISLMLSPVPTVSAAKLGVLSPEGRCKTFDQSADGYVRGEGVGVILLKPYDKAIEDGDHVYSVIKGSGVNHGGKANSLTAPNPEAQASLLSGVYKKAQIPPSTVTYIETHGTGTKLGDPIEIEGLKEAFRNLSSHFGIQSNHNAYCGLGSVKTNIGHLEPAAGIAGLIKAILAMRHGRIPGCLHQSKQNEYINLEKTPFYIVTNTRSWSRLKSDDGKVIPRRAGISSFGFGGANAHVVIEEPTHLGAQPQANGSEKSSMVVLSAKNEGRLKEYARSLCEFLEKRCNNHESIDPG